MVRALILYLHLFLVLFSPLAWATGEALFDSVFSKQGFPMLLIDPDTGNILAANPAASKFYGYPPNTLQSMQIQEINALDPDTVAEERALAAKQNRNYFVFRHRLATGETRMVEVSSVPINYKGQNALFSIINDASELQEAEEALWHYQNRLQDMVDQKTAELHSQQQQTLIQMTLAIGLLLALSLCLAAVLYKRNQTERKLAQEKQRLDDVIWGTDAATWDFHLVSGRIYINRRWASIIGYELEELLPVTFATWEQLCHPEDTQSTQIQVEDILAGKRDFYDGEFRLKHKQGHWVWVRGRGKVVERDSKGRAIRMSGTNQDISQQKQLHAQLEHMAHFDQLTGLPNRALFYDRFEQLLKSAERQHQTFAMLFIDLDGFKSVNDTHGHKAGDYVLSTAANRMSKLIRRSDTVARIGGDEFAMLLQDVRDRAAIEKLAAEILEELHQAYRYQNKSAIYLSCSIGIALYPDDAKDLEGLITHADIAMYHAKNSGKNQMRFAADNKSAAQ